MTSAYQQIQALIDKLTPAELAALIGAASKRLQGIVGNVEEEEDADEGGRRYLPRLPQLIEWGVVVPMEDKLHVSGYEDQPALLLDAYRVAFQGEPLPINDWAKSLTGWKSVNIYESVVVERERRTLDELRHEYMEEHGIYH